MNYSHLSEEERYRIGALRIERKSLSEIARRLGRSPQRSAGKSGATATPPTGTTGPFTRRAWPRPGGAGQGGADASRKRSVAGWSRCFLLFKDQRYSMFENAIRVIEFCMILIVH
jgi:hypothetical protein